MEGDLPACTPGAPGAPPPPPPPCAGPNCDKKYWITVSDWPMGAKGFGHVGVAVGDSPGTKPTLYDTNGWATKYYVPFFKQLLNPFKSYPGLLRNDWGTYQEQDVMRNGKLKHLDDRTGGADDVSFSTDAAGRDAAAQVVHGRELGNGVWPNAGDDNSPTYDPGVGNYSLYGRNCALHVEDVLHAGHVPGVPYGVIFPSALWGVLDQIGQ